jgi:excinuclease ABC subunit C
MADPTPPPTPQIDPREKVKTFPPLPGVYLMKDDRGRVIYIGKAVNLRNRAGSYFTRQAAEDLRTAKLVLEIRDLDYIRTCTLDIKEADERWRWFRPCLLASIHQCTAPCNQRISRDDYRRDIRRLRMFLDGKKETLFKELRDEMQTAARELRFEKAARLRDQIKSLENLNLCGDLREHAQPEVFQVDPKRGLRGLKKIFELPSIPRRIEGMDIAHLQGGETVASCVQFIDGLPFKHGYKRFKIRTVDGVDDFASMREVVSRHFRRLQQEGEPFPDLLLIDGGKGQLGAAMAALDSIGVKAPFVCSLAKKEEELFLPGQSDPKVLSKHSFALRLLQYVRDESHRFAQQYHHLLRKKSQFGDESK